MDHQHATKVERRGLGFFGALALVFIVLKLTGNIDWAWIWVLSPLWAPFVVFLVIVIGVMGIALIMEKLSRGRRW